MKSNWFSVLIGTAIMFGAGSASADMMLAKKSGCVACHDLYRKVVGPSFFDIAQRYRDVPSARDRLIQVVKNGGSGNWTYLTGGVPMPPYSPRVSNENIEQLVDFILGLVYQI